ncbi:bifunctional ADP-dependent NAD(P)H-hydrate dehydratase/NAD(P)H-hydrate epimerase [Pigmentiphaga soli]|uniref:Bifunctional NAD(P)H-hydrate repair enzyme n=1 Tax=Pigmentiphaga soli TaxID=1007095 RepID=A0ABP8HG41_9BURK
MNAPHRLLRTAVVRAIETSAAAALPPQELMRRAAQAAARRVMARWPAQRVAILCGPGNNGGDGAMLAACLHRLGRAVEVWRLAGGREPADAAQAWRECPPQLLRTGDPDTGALPADRSLLIVDALFGIGLARPLPPQAAQWADWANAHPGDVLALDVPSGLDADTGAAQPHAIVAAETLTFIADKPGLHTLAGPDHAGMVHVDDLGLGHTDAIGFDAPGLVTSGLGALTGPRDHPALFAPRRQDTHKGSFGTVGILAGAPGMTGAALLAGRAALRGGAGKVLVGLAEREPALPCDPLQPELMLRSADSLLDHGEQLGVTAWIAGCGLGDSPHAEAWLTHLLRTMPAVPLVLDADALTLIARSAGLASQLAARGGARVLTPHPREASRLLGADTAAVQADRIAAACEIARRFRAWAVLKGAGSVVASPEGGWTINGSGNPGLATAGTGDVLAGLLGALLAQGLDAASAVRGGVWLHGAAADALAARGVGPIGMTAAEVIDAARALRNGGGIPKPYRGKQK